jgi:HPt (histidine-containing phosphotransfer) domain-containing protein
MGISTPAVARADTVRRRAAKPKSTAIEPVSAPPLDPGQEVIDLAHLARMTLGERELEREILQLFDVQAGMLISRMTSETPKAVAGFAHTLAGSASGIGAWKVAEAAEALERLASRPGPASLTAAVNRLGAAVEQAQSAIAELLRPR